MEQINQTIPEVKPQNLKDDKYQKPLKWAILGIIGFMIVILIFGAGMFVGGTKAKFSYKWAENYHRNFAGPQGGFMADWQGAPPIQRDFIGSNGAFGQIIKINDSNIVIGGGDAEKVIVITADTILEKGMTKVTKDELEVGDRVVVVGSPNDQGQIVAKLIRIFPAPISMGGKMMIRILK